MHGPGHAHAPRVHPGLPLHLAGEQARQQAQGGAMTGDEFVQRLARLVDELFEDEADLRLFRDWLQLYRAQRRRLPPPAARSEATPST
ncbi:MAG TPA: hypothetical protein VGJ60_07195 [Chloroflexota bacterium]